MGGNVNHLVELGIASLTTKSLENDEYTPKNYRDAARSSKWRKSMLADRVALDKRGCCKMDRCPLGVKLIRSRYFYKPKKDWTGKVVKWKSRLVILGCSQIKGIDFTETFATVAKAKMFD